MKIVVVPDSFKGSMTAIEASQMITEGLLEFDSTIEVIQLPMADGGEGTVETILNIVGGEKIECLVSDPLGRQVKASYGWDSQTKTAFIETAAASGLPLLKQDELNPYVASTYGTGELTRHALLAGAKKLIIGLGGSATVDAGIGFFQALGLKVYDAEENELAHVGGRIAQIARIDCSELLPQLQEVEIRVASDVVNPLLGAQGAIQVYGPQKGIKEMELAAFERGMKHLANVMTTATNRNMVNAIGSGAAGGFGFSLQSILPVQMMSGIHLLLQISQFEEHIQTADLILTGEGQVDAQSLFGKVPVGVAEYGLKHGIPVLSFCGKLTGDITELKKKGICSVLPIVDEPMSLQEAMESGPSLLRKASKRMIELWSLASSTNRGGGT